MLEESKKNEMRNSLFSLADNLNLIELKRICNGELSYCQVSLNGIEHEVVGRIMTSLIALDFSCEYSENALIVKARQQKTYDGSGVNQQIWHRLCNRRIEVNGTAISVNVREENLSTFDQSFSEFAKKCGRLSELRAKLILQSLCVEELKELEMLKNEIPELERGLGSLLVSDVEAGDGSVKVYINGIWPVRVGQEKVGEFRNNELQIELFSKQISTWKAGPLLADHLTRAQQNRILVNALNKRKGFVNGIEASSELFFNEMNEKIADIENVTFMVIPIFYLQDWSINDENIVEESSSRYRKDISDYYGLGNSRDRIDLNIYRYRTDTGSLILSKSEQ